MNCGSERSQPHAQPESRVSPTVSEELIGAAEQRALVRNDRRRDCGLFGPDSISWKINREAALFLGAGRAALLQLAHPWVAAALEQHSSLMSKPIARFHNTFRIVFAMIFGSLDQALAASRHLYQLHTHIEGELAGGVAGWPAGTHYEANEVAALRWVFATLVESAVLAYEVVRPALNPEELESYYRESKTLAALFGLSETDLPEDWAGFVGYCRAMEESTALGVSDGARVMAQSLLAGAGSWIKPPSWYRAMTVEWLCPRLRSEFQLSFGSREVVSVERTRKRLPRLYRQLPTALRFVGPWQEAQARLRGKGPGWLTKASNHFWIGQARLPFEEPTRR